MQATNEKAFDFENFSLILNFTRFKMTKEEIAAIKLAIEKTLAVHHIKNTELSFTMVDPSEIKRLNCDFRNIDRVTDVLSFPIDDQMLGDIVVCKKRLTRQAKAYGNSYLRELSYLTVHSVLHLLGYDHMEKRDKQLMRKMEKEIMKDLEGK